MNVSSLLLKTFSFNINVKRNIVKEESCRNHQKKPIYISTGDDTSSLMTVPEIAEILGIGQNRAYELLQNGILQGFRICCTWCISKAALDKYIHEKSGLI